MKRKIKPIKAYAVVNMEFGELCLTGHAVDEHEKGGIEMVDVGKAIFDTKEEAREYKQDYVHIDWSEIRVVPVLISFPIKTKKK